MEIVEEVGLEPSEVKKFLMEFYFSGGISSTSVFLVGRPGIGKSQTVRDAGEEIAKKLGKEFIEYTDSVADEILENPEKYFVFVDFRLTETEPSDLIGIPRPENGHVVYKPLKWAVVLSKASGILFLDELNMVQRPDIEAITFKILNDRMVGFIKLSDKVMVVSAGNRPEQNPLARPLACPVMGRLLKIDVRTPSIDEWIKWMNWKYGEDWDRTVAVFLKRFPAFFISSPGSSRTLEVFPEPRKWTKLALVSHKLPEDALEVATIGLVGQEAGRHYLVFKKMKVPSEAEVLENPEVLDSLRLDAQRLAIAQVAQKFDEKDIRKYDRFLKYLNNNDKEALLIFMLMLPRKKLKKLLSFSLKNKDFSEIIEFAIKTEKIAIEIEKLGGY